MRSHGAIGRQEMRLYHQPIVDIATGRAERVRGADPLAAGDGTIVPPGDVHPDRRRDRHDQRARVVGAARSVEELRSWIDDGVVRPSTTMSVNVSPRQIADPDFPADRPRRARAERRARRTCCGSR